MSLDDALLDRILAHLVGISDVQQALKTVCLINKRMTMIIKQPLTAWSRCEYKCLALKKERDCKAQLPHLARWLAAVAPAFVKLNLRFFGWSMPERSLCQLLDATAILPLATKLQARISKLLCPASSISKALSCIGPQVPLCTDHALQLAGLIFKRLSAHAALQSNSSPCS